ncbi:8-amino-7-oxononanoate synthase, partial [Streptomyces sioyaensis]
MPQDSAPTLLRDGSPAAPAEPRRPAHGAAFDWLDEARDERRRAGLVRTLRPRPADHPLLDLAGNDYLGLARHPEVTRGGGAGAPPRGAGAPRPPPGGGGAPPHPPRESVRAPAGGGGAAV